jgi:hypothetical protein
MKHHLKLDFQRDPNFLKSKYVFIRYIFLTWYRILDEFRSLRWTALEPKHLEFDNCQFLLIGHKDHSFEKGTETDKDEKDPKEELEKLEHEDEIRVEHLKGMLRHSPTSILTIPYRHLGDDTVFEDLGIDAKDYPKVPTTW